MTGLTVDVSRLGDELNRLAAISDHPAPAVTRVLFSETDLKARALVRELCLAVGLTVREDAVGNLFARWIGNEPSLPPVGTGSHTDAIPHAGMYDGTVGVLGGLEAIRALQAAGVRPRRSIELLMFTAEEPTRFGIGCLGSRALAGAIRPERLLGLKDADGVTFDQWRARAGYAGSVESVRLDKGFYSAFVELHIEQGPILEQEGIPIGIVTAIAAPAAKRLTFEGLGGHAGTVLMPERRDALCAAAEVILAVESAVKETGAIDTVGTVGVCKVHPGAINSIPARVVLEVDVRDTDVLRREQVLDHLRDLAHDISVRRKVTVTTEVLSLDPPAICGAEIMAAAEEAVKDAGLTSKRLVSRAYHDSLFMAQICPTGMVFIPCRGGVSHRPDEYSSPEQIRAGVEVLARTLARLAV